LEPIKGIIMERDLLLISIAAGKTLENLEEMVGHPKVSIIRVMPNVNVQIGLGASAVTGNEASSENQIDFVLNLFSSVGKAWIVPEKDFSAFIAMAGSSPAFTYLYIDSLARAGVKHGLTKEKALEYAAQATLGSAAMILESKENPWSLIDRVSSPGGTTVAGLLALEDQAFLSTVVKGVDATIARDVELSE
ncbi:MAG: pyrroline-5-carboxylate reductase, partial [Streptococcaceae bacterium]|nr:pyrroline-5-carboxylate reductase [Streptococcaceae bacterium]